MEAPLRASQVLVARNAGKVLVRSVSVSLAGIEGLVEAVEDQGAYSDSPRLLLFKSETRPHAGV